MPRKPINRIKVVLVESGKTNKWLAQKLKVNPATVSGCCTNDMQPSLETLIEISDALNVNVRNYSYLIDRDDLITKDHGSS